MPSPSRPLRVGFYIFFPGGGIGRYTHRLMTALGRRDEVAVEALCTPDYEWAHADGYATWDGLARLSHNIPTLRRWRFLKGQFVNPKRAIEHARTAALDVLHLANINHLSFPYWRPKVERANVRVVASAHDVKRGKSILSRRWEDRQLKAFYRFADALFVHSEYQVRELSAFAGVPEERIHVVPHGPYTHGAVNSSQRALRQHWDLPTGRRVALFFGKLRDGKNLEGLLRAQARTDPRPYLVVAGPEDGRHHGVDHYQRLAGELGLADDVRFLPRRLDDDEVGALFTAADWVALPYDESFTSQSGVLNVAAHYERPVLVSSAPVLRETVDTCDIGVACSGDTPAALADGIAALHRRLATGHRHAFETYRERFGWAENASHTLTVYHSLLS